MKGCRPLNRQERHAALAGCKDAREKALLALGFATGYRVSELLSLRICDVLDPQGNVMRFVTVTAGNSKTGVGRTIMLNGEAGTAVAALAKVLLGAGGKPTDALFQGRKNKGASISRIQAWRLLKDLFARVAVYGAVATHTMRKTFAAEMYRLLDGRIEKVAVALGHKSINSTQSYLSFNNAEIDDAIGNMYT